MANVKNNSSAKETKRRLIEAAGEVFAQHGFERATIKEITDRADASVAAVNYHFSDKQELYDQVVQYVHERGDETFKACGDVPTDLPPKERLKAFVAQLVSHVLDPSQPTWRCQIKTREMQHPSAATERFIEQSIRPYVRQLEEVVQDLLEQPVPQLELTRLVNSVIGQCIYYAHSRELLVRLYPDQPSPADVADELADHITRFSLAALSCWRAPAKG
ncbi:MAG: transcriptional regulator, TetR family [Phycisphaerales bacterium]|nr:transcriptional regulator, TetR family [Phycisphaerales bacterium]